VAKTLKRSDESGHRVIAVIGRSATDWIAKIAEIAKK
jgi:hypothetical protein